MRTPKLCCGAILAASPALLRVEFVTDRQKNALASVYASITGQGGDDGTSQSARSAYSDGSSVWLVLLARVAPRAGVSTGVLKEVST